MGVIEERLPGRGHRPRLTEPSARVGGDVELHALGDADPAGVACGEREREGREVSHVEPLLRVLRCASEAVRSCRALVLTRPHV